MRRTIALDRDRRRRWSSARSCSSRTSSASASSRGPDRGWPTPAPAGAAVVVGLLAADIFIPVPSSVIMVLSGAAFGVWWGSLLAFAGSIGGEWLGFELARRYGTALSTRFIGDERERRRLNDVLVTHGAAAIVVTRALPVVMETMSIVAGLSTMRRSTFLIASAIGTAPIVVVYAYAGAMSRETGSLVPAIVILIAVAAAAGSGIALVAARYVGRRLLPQRRAIEAEQLRRLHLVAVGDGQRFLDERGFDRVDDVVEHRRRPSAHRPAAPAARTRTDALEARLPVGAGLKHRVGEERDVVGGDDVAAGEDGGARQHALELADVAGPRVLLQLLRGLIVHAADAAIQLGVDGRG